MKEKSNMYFQLYENLFSIITLTNKPHVNFRGVPGIFGNQQDRYIDVIHNMLTQSLCDQSPHDVSWIILINSKCFSVTDT